DEDMRNALLCSFGNDVQKPLDDLCDCIADVAAAAGREPRELVEEALRPDLNTGAVTFLPSDGAGGGEVARLDPSKSPEVRELLTALREAVDALVRVGEEQLADGRPLAVVLLQVCLEHAVRGGWGDLTRRVMVDQALDRIATSPDYETNYFDLTVRRRER